MTAPVDYGAETTANPVANDSATESFRRDDTEAKRFAERVIRQEAKNEETSLEGRPGDADALKISTTSNPPGAGKLHCPDTGTASGDRGIRNRKAPGSLPVKHRVALVVNLGTLGDEALAALLTAATNDIAAGLGGHAGAEPVLVLAGALGGLVSPFHLFR
jgi:hypothetical protein